LPSLIGLSSRIFPFIPKVTSADELFEYLGKMIEDTLNESLHLPEESRAYRDQIKRYLAPALTNDRLMRARVERDLGNIATSSTGIPQFIFNRIPLIPQGTQQIARFLAPERDSQNIEYSLRVKIRAVFSNQIVTTIGENRFCQNKIEEEQFNSLAICNVTKLLKNSKICEENIQLIEQGNFKLKSLIDEESLNLLTKINRPNFQDVKCIDLWNVFSLDPNLENFANFREAYCQSSTTFDKVIGLEFQTFLSGCLSQDLSESLLKDEAFFKNQAHRERIAASLKSTYQPVLNEYYAGLITNIESEIEKIDSRKFVSFLDKDKTGVSFDFEGLARLFEPVLKAGGGLPNLGSPPLSDEPVPTRVQGSIGSSIHAATKSPLQLADVAVDLIFKHTPREVLAETLLKVVAEQWLIAFPIRA
jgi:hypothetical protein